MRAFFPSGVIALGLSLLCSSQTHADPVPAGEAPMLNSSLGLHDESEVGIVITSGNSVSHSIDLKQLSTYGWSANLVKLIGKYLTNSANGTDTARYWLLGLRYERELTELLSVFAGQNIESDVFSGYLQRYSTDGGGKYFLYKEEAFNWSAEAGYRYTVENQLIAQTQQSYLRVYTEANRNWTKTFSTRLDLEYLPNLSQWRNYLVNAELSLTAAINDVFAIKTGYGVRYRNLPPPPATHNTDTQFTTTLVAKL